jgi:hypothetical protein
MCHKLTASFKREARAKRDAERAPGAGSAVDGAAAAAARARVTAAQNQNRRGGGDGGGVGDIESCSFYEYVVQVLLRRSIVFFFVLLFRWCECSCDFYLCSLHSALAHLSTDQYATPPRTLDRTNRWAVARLLLAFIPSLHTSIVEGKIHK